MALKYFVGFVTSYINIFGASSHFGLGYCKLALGLGLFFYSSFW